MVRILALLATVAALAPAGRSQTVEPENSFLMVNQHVCLPARMDEVIEMFDTQIVPIMAELQGEGMIGGYGRIVHAWGDEWNFGFFWTTTDHAAFVTAWNAFASRVFERHPEQMETFLTNCTMHKDNLYNMTSYQPTGQ